jgi:hypothetical protein
LVSRGKTAKRSCHDLAIKCGWTYPKLPEFAYHLIAFAGMCFVPLGDLFLRRCMIESAHYVTACAVPLCRCMSDFHGK